jgi:hypothetical protein
MLLMLYIFEGRGNAAEVAPAPYTKLAGSAPPIPSTRATTSNGSGHHLGIHVQSPQAPPYMPYAPPQLGGRGGSGNGGRASGGSGGARDSPRSGNGYGNNAHNGPYGFGTPPSADTPPFSVERGSRFDRFDRDRYDEHNRDLFALD